MNEPLTLEQLRKIDRKPVWIENFNDPSKSEWKICYQGQGDYLIFQGGCLQRTTLEEYGENWFKEYGKTWLAYHCPPNEPLTCKGCVHEINGHENCNYCIRAGYLSDYYCRS